MIGFGSHVLKMFRKWRSAAGQGAGKGEAGGAPAQVQEKDQ